MSSAQDSSPYAAAPALLAAGSRIGYASWSRRVGAFLLDQLLLLPGLVCIVASVPFLFGQVDPATGRVEPAPIGAVLVLVLGYVLLFAMQIWNRWYRQGRTGKSWGKQILGITLVRERDGQPVGVLVAFAREVAHVVDGILWLGYLWPLWDARRQTFADKLCSTVVLDDAVTTPPRP